MWVEFKVTEDTEIHRNPLRGTGGRVTIGKVGDTVEITAPHDPQEAAKFWQYLSNVAADMATYCETDRR